MANVVAGQKSEFTAYGFVSFRGNFKDVLTYRQLFELVEAVVVALGREVTFLSAEYQLNKRSTYWVLLAAVHKARQYRILWRRRWRRWISSKYEVLNDKAHRRHDDFSIFRDISRLECEHIRPACRNVIERIVPLGTGHGVKRRRIPVVVFPLLIEQEYVSPGKRCTVFVADGSNNPADIVTTHYEVVPGYFTCPYNDLAHVCSVAALESE